MPGVAVEGVGATEEPVPPVGTVYHNKLLPVAVNGEATAPTQYTTGVTTVGGAAEVIFIV